MTSSGRNNKRIEKIELCRERDRGMVQLFRKDMDWHVPHMLGFIKPRR